MSCTEESAGGRTDGLVARIKSRLFVLPDHEMRTGVLLRALSDLDPEEIVCTLATAVSEAAEGDEKAGVFLAVFSGLIISLDNLEAPFYDRMAAAYSTARESGETLARSKMLSA